MRRNLSTWDCLRSGPALVFASLTAALMCCASTALAAKPQDAELAMAERGTPPGEGWSLVSSMETSSRVSTNSVAAPVAPEAPTAPAVQAAPNRTVASDGWQPLTATPNDASTAEPSASATATQLLTPPPVQVANPYVLVGGKSLQAQMLSWAKRSGWAIDWRTPDDWIVPNDKAFGTDFEVAVRDVFDQVGANGADVRVDVWQGNRSIVVDKTGAE